MTPTHDEALPVVAWRFKYKNEPGMLGHYPWSYQERAPRANSGLLLNHDVEELVRATDARAALAEAEAEIGRLRGALEIAVQACMTDTPEDLAYAAKLGTFALDPSSPDPLALASGAQRGGEAHE
jgi:hypothetical protein